MMAFDPSERRDRLKELMKPIDRQIMMCDDVQDLFALSSIMVVTSKNIFVQQLGRKGAIEIFEKVLEDLENER
jgi:hypothetical protein